MSFQIIEHDEYFALLPMAMTAYTYDPIFLPEIEELIRQFRTIAAHCYERNWHGKPTKVTVREVGNMVWVESASGLRQPVRYYTYEEAHSYAVALRQAATMIEKRVNVSA